MTTTQYFQNTPMDNQMHQTLPQNSHRINELEPLLSAFIWFLLNNCMNKRHLQFEIGRKEERDTKRTDAWLKAEGITPYTFAHIDVELLQAQRIAHNCLKHHPTLLTKAETETLTRFTKAVSRTKTRRRIKASRTHQVMNIGNRVNRQVFKQARQQSRQAQANNSR